MTDKLLTVAEAAEILSVNRKTIYRWVKAGKLPARKIPGRQQGEIRIEQADLAALTGDAKPIRTALADLVTAAQQAHDVLRQSSQGQAAHELYTAILAARAALGDLGQ